MRTGFEEDGETLEVPDLRHKQPLVVSISPASKTSVGLCLNMVRIIFGNHILL